MHIVFQKSNTHVKSIFNPQYDVLEIAFKVKLDFVFNT